MDNREDRIRQKAHELWEHAGRPDHKADEHWSKAEQEVDREHRGDNSDEPANEPNPRHQAIDIGPGPDGDIHTVPDTMGPAKRGL
jgi:hypothetical protein